MTVHVSQPSGNPQDRLTAAKVKWKAEGRDTATLTGITLELEDARHIIPPDKVEIYLAKMIEAAPDFDLPSGPDPDEALFAATDAPATAPQEPERSELHKAAREYAAKGWKVFPCISDAQGRTLPPKERKKPATARGFKDASNDLGQVDAWWSENPDYNIALSPADIGQAVIDQDTGGDVSALALPDTRVSNTPSGGRHYWFIGDLPPSASKLAPHVDTRGRGSYVLVPPSIVNGKPYTWADEREPELLPAEIEARLAVRVEPAKALADVEIDSEAAINAAVGYLKRCDVGTCGVNGNDTGFKTAAWLHDLGISPEKSRELMLEHWNPRCEPLWSEEEVRQFTRSAEKSAQNEIGAKAPQPASQVFAEAKLAPEEPEKPTPFFMNVSDLLSIPDADPLIENFIMQRENVCLFGPEKLAKTFTALDVALSIAARVPVFGSLKVCKPGPVFYLTAEGQFGFKQRIMAWGKAHNIDVRKLPFYFHPAVPRAMNGQEQTYIDEIRRQAGCDPSLIVFDTMANSIEGEDENSSKALSMYWRMVRTIGMNLDCSTLTIAHTGKDVDKGIRGWSGTGGTIDRSITADGDREAKTLRLHHKYAKDTGDFPDCYLHLKVVPLSQGKSSAVIEPITKAQFESKAVNQVDSVRATRTVLAAKLIELKAFSRAQGRTLDNMAEILAGPEPRGDDTEERIRWQTRRSTWRENLRNGTRERSGGKGRPKSAPQLRGLFTPEDLTNSGTRQPIFWMPEPDTANEELED